MTKKNIIDQLVYELKKLNYQNHPAIVEAVINDIYCQFIGEMSPMNLDVFEFYAKEYDVSVSLDTDSNRYCSTLPVAIVNLKRPQGGVLGINSTEGTGHRYYPTTEQELRRTANLESGLYDRYYGFYVQGSKVWYTGMTSILAAAGVRMTLVPQFKSLLTTDEVNIPAAMDYNLKQLVIDRITNQQIIDLQIEEKD